MKISKKLLSLLLVVMLLATVIPFQAMAVSATKAWYNYTYSIEGTTFTGKAMTNDEGKAFLSKADLYAEMELTAGDVPEWDAEINKLSFPIEITQDNQFIIALTTSDNGDQGGDNGDQGGDNGDQGGDNGDQGGDNGTGDITPDVGPDGSVGGKVTVYVDYNLNMENGQPYPVSPRQFDEGSEYLDVLAAPETAGYTFNGWYSEALGRKIKAGDEVIDGDTVSARWSAPTKYTITYDLMHDDQSPIKRTLQVSYGEEISAKLYGYIPTREGYVFMGWKINGSIASKTNYVYTWQGDVVAEAVWSDESIYPGTPNPPEKDGKTYLEIYVNGDTGTLVKRVNLTTGYPAYLKDGYVTRAEAETIARKYVTVKTGYKLSFEGLFDEESWYWFSHDPETDGAASIKVDGWNDQYIFVMVNNVKKTSNADPTNAKTGDFILTGALSMMAISSISAAAVYVTGKKRK